MTAITGRVGVAAVLALSTLIGAGAAVSEPATTTLFKPLQGVSLHLGSKHAIGYFVADSKVCQLTLVVGDEIRDNDVVPTTDPARFRAAVAAGKTVRFDTGTGTELQFTCGPNATAMSMMPLKQVAYSAVKK